MSLLRNHSSVELTEELYLRTDALTTANDRARWVGALQELAAILAQQFAGIPPAGAWRTISVINPDTPVVSSSDQSGEAGSVAQSSEAPHEEDS